ncbi:MAG TPA: hypothetical protein VGM73_14770 [Candidatus Didemnitutus sp.]|jgi:hypothetical protein
MRLPRPGLLTSALLLLGAGIVPPVRGGLFTNYWGSAIVATDTTPEGEKLSPPSPAQPVYFLGRSLGHRLGSIGGDDEPDQQEFDRLITGILAKQGYLAGDPKVPARAPTVFIIVQWGYLEPRSNDLLWFLGYNPSQDIASPVLPGQLGPEVFRRNMRSRTVETILENANDPIYGIIITAFEYKSMDTSRAVIYWQTRIGLPANGKSMAQALPTMLTSAGPAIGRPSDKPVLVDTDQLSEGQVKAGEIKIIGIVPENAAPAEAGGKK